MEISKREFRKIPSPRLGGESILCCTRFGKCFEIIKYPYRESIAALVDNRCLSAVNRSSKRTWGEIASSVTLEYRVLITRFPVIAFSVFPGSSECITDYISCIVREQLAIRLVSGKLYRISFYYQTPEFQFRRSRLKGLLRIPVLLPRLH